MGSVKVPPPGVATLVAGTRPRPQAEKGARCTTRTPSYASSREGGALQNTYAFLCNETDSEAQGGATRTQTHTALHNTNLQ